MTQARRKTRTERGVKTASKPEAEREAQRERLEAFRRLRQFAAEVAQANQDSHLQELGLHMVASQLYELLAGFDAGRLKKKLSGDLRQYLQLVGAVARVSESGLKQERYREELAEKKARIEKELQAARESGGLSREALDRIERELKLF